MKKEEQENVKEKEDEEEGERNREKQKRGSALQTISHSSYIFETSALSSCVLDLATFYKPL